MGVLVILGCWVTTVLFFFGHKVVALYDVALSLLTHFIPLGPVLLILALVVLIVALAPKRPAAE